jgi:hypothetical protein
LALVPGARAVSPVRPAKPRALAGRRSAPVSFPLAPVDLQLVACRQVDSGQPVVMGRCQAWAAGCLWLERALGAAGAPFHQCAADAPCCRSAAPGAGFHSVRVSMKVCVREPTAE